MFDGSTTNDKFHVTFFEDEFAQSLTEKEMTLGELRELVIATTAATKGELPLLKLALFGDKRTDRHCLRHNANVVEISGIEGDYDAKEVAFGDAVKLVKAKRIKALLYTSSGYTPAEPKWRIIAPTSRSLPPPERAKMVARVNGALNGVLAGESFTLSQSFYFGHVNSNPDFQAITVEGDYVDLRDDLDAGAIGKKTTSSADRSEEEVRSFNITDVEPDDPMFANFGADWMELATRGTGPRGFKERYKGDRSRAAIAWAACCLRHSLSDDAIASTLLRWKIGDHVRDQSNVERAISRTIAQAHEYHVDSKLFAMNEKHCVLPVSGKTRVVTWVDDPNFPEHKTIAMFSSLADFKSLHDKYRHTYQKDGETVTVKLGAWWVGNPGRRQYDGGMRFAPTRDEDVIDGNTLNLWQGFGVAARKPEGKSGAAGCKLLLDHGLNIICSGDAEHFDYLIKREALIAQKRTRSEISVGLKTEGEGTGKGLWSRSLNRIYGTHAMEIQNPEHVVGKHNPHLEKLLRMTADEALFALNPLHRNALYNLITEPRIMIEPKFVNAYPADNHLNIDVISNAEHFLPVSGFARRFFVPTVSQAKANDHKYFEAILKQLRDGGYEALLYHLLHEVDIRDFNVRAVPKTAALYEQVAYSRKGVDLLVEAACNEGRVPCQLRPGFSNCTGYAQRGGFDYFIDHHSDRDLHQLGALKVKRRLKRDWNCITGSATRTQASGSRVYGIVWPELAELREKFEDKYGEQEWLNADINQWRDDEESF